MNVTTKKTIKKKSSKPSEKQQRLTLDKIQTLQGLLVSEYSEVPKVPGSEAVWSPVLSRGERALVIAKIFELIETL